jgi:GAF domain-containing protein
VPRPTPAANAARTGRARRRRRGHCSSQVRLRFHVRRVPASLGLVGRASHTAGVPSPPSPDLAETLAAVTRALDTDSLQATLQRTVDRAVATIPGCDHAGISTVHYGKISTPAASDAVALRVDAIQYEAGEGPCRDALAAEGMFQTDDLTLESRWPKFSARAHVETGVTSILSFRLTAREGSLGALNLFSRRSSAFGEEAREIGLLFATHAAVAMQASRRTEKLLAAPETRDLIGQAKGILMERQQITDEEAFQILVRASQRLNIKLTVVAGRLTEDKAPSALEATDPSRSNA